jgi:hypothetical protein
MKMSVKNIAYNLLVVVVLLSYSFTIPLLSSIHSHNTFVTKHITNDLQLHSTTTSSKEDSRTCEVCFRITSTHVVITTDAQFHAILPVESCLVLQKVTSYFSTTHLLLQDRAPPISLA